MTLRKKGKIFHKKRQFILFFDAQKEKLILCFNIEKRILKISFLKSLKSL